jgi:hypothetical protein
VGSTTILFSLIDGLGEVDGDGLVPSSLLHLSALSERALVRRWAGCSIMNEELRKRLAVCAAAEVSWPGVPAGGTIFNSALAMPR